MKTPKQLRRDIHNLSEHLSQVQAGLQSRASIRVASIGKECQRTAHALEQLLKSQQVPSEYKVAVVGRFKAGKSTFVNELLSNRLAGEGTLPETAAVTTFKHGPNVRARIQFVASRTWQELKSLHAENPKHPDAHRVRSWEGFAVPKKTKDDEPEKVFDLAGLEREHVREGDHTVTLELPTNATKKATAEFRRKLKEYTSSASPLHCLVDKIDITAPAEILDHGVLLIDTPGLGDTERFRVALTEKVVADVDAVLFLTKSGASYDQSEKDFLLSLLRKGTVKQLIVVVTQIDETYDKVLKAAEDDDEDPEPLTACIARERAKIAREIADTLKDLHQDDSLHRYQEQLGDVPIVFTSARLHRDWKDNKSLPFVIKHADPGGVEDLKKKLLHQLSIESRLAQTAESLVRGASNSLLDLQEVLQTKLRALNNTQNKEVAEKKLHTFRNEFGQAREGFAGSVEQQILLLTERLGEQPRRDETLLQLIAALAEQPLSVLSLRTWDAIGKPVAITGGVTCRVCKLVWQGLCSPKCSSC
jgi:tRNA U34 5-carboxymethylaminomethyl modifying GTPase MnmE/TrmE